VDPQPCPATPTVGGPIQALCAHDNNNGAAVGCALRQATSDDYNHDDYNNGGSANAVTSDCDNATSTTKMMAMMTMATVARVMRWR